MRVCPLCTGRIVGHNGLDLHVTPCIECGSRDHAGCQHNDVDQQGSRVLSLRDGGDGPTKPDYHEGSRLLNRTLDRAVTNDGLSFTEALDIHTECITGVLRAAIELRRSVQEQEAAR